MPGSGPTGKIGLIVKCECGGSRQAGRSNHRDRGHESASLARQSVGHMDPGHLLGGMHMRSGVVGFGMLQ